MDLVGADYPFIWVNIGSQGGCSDAQIWNQRDLKLAIERGLIGMPEATPLPGDDIPIGYYIDNDGTSRACHPNCKTCTNTSFSSCIACNHYRGDNSQMALSGYCSCWKGSVDLGDGRCEIETLVGLQKAS